MKVLFAICVLFTIFAHVLCDLRYRGNAVHSDYPGQCYYKELNQAIPKNQSFKPINIDDHCESIFCRTDNVLEMRSCVRNPNLVPNETCRIESDITRAYPDCCPKRVCQNDSNFI